LVFHNVGKAVDSLPGYARYVGAQPVENWNRAGKSLSFKILELPRPVEAGNGT
jgi:hypothetical protein